MSIADRLQLVGTSTAQQLADGLVAMIVEGAIAPGERIRESRIATELGVSRNTVREAVRLLQGTGLVRYSFNRGLVVWDPTDDEILDLYAARGHLEAAAATAIHADSDLGPLREAFDAFTTSLATKDARAIVETDLALHRATIATMGSARLLQMYDALLDDLRYCVLVLSIDHREYEDSAALEAEHRHIVEAFEARDPAVARATVTAITDANRDAVRDIIRRRSR